MESMDLEGMDRSRAILRDQDLEIDGMDVRASTSDPGADTDGRVRQASDHTFTVPMRHLDQRTWREDLQQEGPPWQVTWMQEQGLLNSSPSPMDTAKKPPKEEQPSWDVLDLLRSPIDKVKDRLQEDVHNQKVKSTGIPREGFVRSVLNHAHQYFNPPQSPVSEEETKFRELLANLVPEYTLRYRSQLLPIQINNYHPSDAGDDLDNLSTEALIALTVGGVIIAKRPAGRLLKALARRISERYIKPKLVHYASSKNEKTVKKAYEKLTKKGRGIYEDKTTGEKTIYITPEAKKSAGKNSSSQFSRYWKPQADSEKVVFKRPIVVRNQNAFRKKAAKAILDQETTRLCSRGEKWMAVAEGLAKLFVIDSAGGYVLDTVQAALLPKPEHVDVRSHVLQKLRETKGHLQSLRKQVVSGREEDLLHELSTFIEKATEHLQEPERQELREQLLEAAKETAADWKGNAVRLAEDIDQQIQELDKQIRAVEQMSGRPQSKGLAVAQGAMAITPVHGAWGELAKAGVDVLIETGFKEHAAREQDAIYSKIPGAKEATKERATERTAWTIAEASFKEVMYKIPTKSFTASVLKASMKNKGTRVIKNEATKIDNEHAQRVIKSIDTELTKTVRQAKGQTVWLASNQKAVSEAFKQGVKAELNR